MIRCFTPCGAIFLFDGCERDVEAVQRLGELAEAENFLEWLR
jgi:hypothetical protein